MSFAFDVALRGYDRIQVDQLLDQAEQAVASNGWQQRRAAVDALRSAEFPLRLRGYDRAQVDQLIQELIRELA